MSAPFRLVPGVAGPQQQSPTTCGAACATVARMLVDAPFARWISWGEGHPVPGAAGGNEAERFAAWERTVQARTNGWRSPDGGLLLPWPPGLGTPPWGLRHELEHGASRRGTRYRIVSLRGLDSRALRARYRRLVDLVVDGEPALLYIGNSVLPRHVTLVLPATRPGELVVYEPDSGMTLPLREAPFVTRRLDLGGWAVPWVLVQPTGHRRAWSPTAVHARWRLPQLATDPAPQMRKGRVRCSSSA